jgi:hypothetical protein
MRYNNWVMAVTLLACTGCQTAPQAKEVPFVGSCRLPLGTLAALVPPENGRSIVVVGRVAGEKVLSGRYRDGHLEGLVWMWPELTPTGWVVSGADVR